MIRKILIIILFFCCFYVPQISAVSKTSDEYFYDYIIEQEIQIPKEETDSCFSRIPYFAVGVISLGITIIIMFTIAAKYKKVKIASCANNYIDENKTEITKKRDKFIRTRTVKLRKSS